MEDKTGASARNARLHPSSPPDRESDTRTESERDRDRVLYTSAFTRLAQVTQVVRPAEGHVFHNRLTHTLEVAQIARRLSQRLAVQQADLLSKHGGLDPDATEAAALAHDLGHPPFGHLAESELDRLVTGAGVVDGFEGNAQSFRIVTALSAHRHGYSGLNLTRATLNGILKYPWVRADADQARPKKFGAYLSELSSLKFAREGAVPRLKSLEAAVMDHADAVAYSVHDLVDFYRAGLIPLGLKAGGGALERELEAFQSSAREPEIGDLVDAHRDSFDRLVDVLPIGSRFSGSFAERAELRACASGLITAFLTGVEFRVHSSGGLELHVPEVQYVHMKFLQNLVWRHVITNPRLATQQWGQRKLISTLFEAYLEAIQADDDHHNIVPPAFQDLLQSLDGRESGLLSLEHRQVRLAADIVASLGEDQATALYRRLLGIGSGAVTDLY